MFYIRNIDVGSNCECCGYIYSYTLECNFDNIQKVFHYDGHFGYGDLSPHWSDARNIEKIMEEYKSSFMSKNIELLHVEYDLLHNVGNDSSTIYYDKFHCKIDGVYKSFDYITEYPSGNKSINDSFYEFFKFLKIDVEYTEKDESSYISYDYDDWQPEDEDDE